jgi:hypothetical protein
MAQIVKITYQLKRGYADRWIEVNPILRQGEPGFEIDTGKLKIGNGIDNWINLSYIGDNNDSGIISVEVRDMLPEIGDASLIYRVINEKALYQWNAVDNVYELLNATDNIEININDVVQTEGDFLILYGGSAIDNI